MFSDLVVSGIVLYSMVNSGFVLSFGHFWFCALTWSFLLFDLIWLFLSLLIVLDFVLEVVFDIVVSLGRFWLNNLIWTY